MNTIYNGPHIQQDSSYRFIPEPHTSPSFNVIREAARSIAGVASNLSSNAGGILGSIAPEMNGQFQDLISLQLDAQKQMMLVSMVSNIEKSKHETQMSAVRNIRVG